MPVWSRYIHEIAASIWTSPRPTSSKPAWTDCSPNSAPPISPICFQRRALTPALDFGQKIIESITTNETSFFRDLSPFELLRNKLIPEILDRRDRTGVRAPIRIWSAACSSGQEAYSTAIVFKEMLGDLLRYDIRILGTDISNKVVAQASYGEYSRLELDRGLAPEALVRHFTLSGDRWRVRDEIRSLVSFRTMNLLEPFTFPSPFDIIFCRNVAIYFSEADKIKLYGNIGRYLAKDGSLIIGSTESISGLCPQLEPKRHLRAVYYQWKKPA